MFCIRLFHSIPANPPARLAAPWVRDRPVRSTQNDCDTIAAERGQIRAPSTYASYFSVLGVPKPQRLPVHLVSSWPIRLDTARDNPYLVKHVLEFVLRQSTALDILHGAQVLCHALAVLLPHRLHLLLGQFLSHARVIPQIDLCTDNEAGNARAVVVHLGEPFLADVLEGCGGGDAEANEEDVGLWV